MGTKLNLRLILQNQPIIEKMKIALLLICIIVGTMKISSAKPLEAEREYRMTGEGRTRDERIGLGDVLPYWKTFSAIMAGDSEERSPLWSGEEQTNDEDIGMETTIFPIMAGEKCERDSGEKSKRRLCDWFCG